MDYGTLGDPDDLKWYQTYTPRQVTNKYIGKWGNNKWVILQEKNAKYV
tara:strand:+ start:323 stop:466 length:144 start_codon:yes stop_codon:yes gene_type:complete